MAIVKPLAKEQRTQALNATHQLPKDCYAVRFIQEEAKPSKSTGNPMVVLTAEIVHPEVIKSPFTGEDLEIAGAQLKLIHLSLRIKDEDGSINEKKTQEAVTRYDDFRVKCGLPSFAEEGIDVENPPLGFKGMVVDAILDSEEFVQRKTPTPEQKAAGKPGDEIINPATGKPIKMYKPFIVSVLGPSKADVSHNPMLA